MQDLQPAAHDIYSKKYQLRDHNDQPVESDVHGTFERVAQALAKVEEGYGVMTHAEAYDNFLWAMENGAIPAGRIISNAGAEEYKPQTTLINCTVSGTIPDNLEGILNKVTEAGMTLKGGAGIGYEFSTLRPSGANVRGVGAQTHGPEQFMEIFDSMCFNITSAGGRRGAQMATFDVSHPDVENIVWAKRQDAHLRQFNISILITSEFMEAVKNNEQWPLVYPLTPSEREEINSGGPVSFDWKYKYMPHMSGAGYPVGDDGTVACRIYRKVNARDLWEQIMTSTYDYAEPGFILIDEYNRMNNNWFIENIRATNPCVTGDTLILTEQGYQPISSLVGQQIQVWNGFEWSEVEPSITGYDRDILAVGLSDGSTIKCTPEHTFVLKNGKRVEASELQVGDKLSKFGFPVIEGGSDWPRKSAYTQGFYSGDGTRNKDDIILYGEKQDLLEHFDYRSAKQYAHWDSMGSRTMVYANVNRDKEFVPGVEVSVQGRLDWLAGLFDSDGGLQDGVFTVWSVNRGFLDKVQKMLHTLGVRSTLSDGKEAGTHPMPDGQGGMQDCNRAQSFRLIISKCNTVQLIRLGLQTHRRDLKSFADPDFDKARYITVESVEAGGVADTVYCFTEYKNHTGIFNGVMTGQCGEQGLPPYGACWTGSMRISTNHGLIRTDHAHELAQKGEDLKIAVDGMFTGSNTELRDCRLVENGQREVKEYHFDNGQRVEMTPDHQIYTPQGWKEIGDLGVGDETFIQSEPLGSFALAGPFRAGALSYFFSSIEGKQIFITNRKKKAVLEELLTEMGITFTHTKGGISISNNHPIIQEVLGLDITSIRSSKFWKGFLWAVQQTAGTYKGELAAYANDEVGYLISKSVEWVTGEAPKITRHTDNTYRVMLPGTPLEKTQMKTTKVDHEFGLYGWLLADGWLTDSVGILINDEDDGAEEYLVPEFQKVTDTTGEYRQVHAGEERDVYQIACYKQEPIHNLKEILGLEKYYSRDIHVPEVVFQGNQNQKASFLSAVFCADGSIHSRNHIRLTTASKEWAEDIQLLLLEFGIHSTIRSAESKGNTFYSLSVQKRHAFRFFQLIGFHYNSRKHEQLRSGLESVEEWQDMSNNGVVRLSNVVDKGVQTVYDIEEPTTNTLIVNGMVVHNCLLGSINLTQMIEFDGSNEPMFSWGKYKAVIRSFTRMLDNVVDINGLPLEEQRNEIYQKRRHGMGFLGLGSTLALLGIEYGSDESLEFTEHLSRVLAVEGWREGLSLAREKGPAPIMEEEFTITKEMLDLKPELRDNGWEEGDLVEGKVLFGFSDYMKRIEEADPALVSDLVHVGCRFTHHTSIAPTGTISLSIGNNASNGIEPSFDHLYCRNIIREGKSTKEKVNVMSFEALTYLQNHPDFPNDPEQLVYMDADKCKEALPDHFVTANDIGAEDHLKVQVAAQKWIDSSISKTTNVPQDYPYESFKDLYMKAYEWGAKGCATFRFNPEAFQGVLTRNQDLHETWYKFKTDKGEEVWVRGTDKVEYKGEIHDAANLHDALKEGQYGKF